MPARPRTGACIAWSIATVIVLGVILGGCGVGPRRPLFSLGDPSPAPRQPPPVTPPPTAPRSDVLLAPQTRPLTGAGIGLVRTSTPTREEIGQLLARLRNGRRGERREVLDRLVAMGEHAIEDVERALEDATFETDVLEDALRRIREAPAPDEPAIPKLGPQTTPRKKPVAAPWVEAKYRLALDKFLAGDDLGAQALVEAIVAREPASAARPKLDRLRRQIRDRLIAETVVSATIAPVASVLAPDGRLEATIVLENRGREAVLLRPGSGAPLGQVTLDYEELGADGTRSLRRTTRPVHAPGELRLAGGERRTLELEIPNEHAAKTPGIVGRYRLSGRLRPFTLLAGEEPLPYFLPLELVEVLVVDPDDVPAAAHAPEGFARAVKAASAEGALDFDVQARHAFTLALVWASRSRDEAVAAIVAALEPAEGRLARVLGAALARAVGEPGSYTKEEWLAWWRTAKSRPRSARAPDDEEDEHVGPGGR